MRIFSWRAPYHYVFDECVDGTPRRSKAGHLHLLSGGGVCLSLLRLLGGPRARTMSIIIFPTSNPCMYVCSTRLSHPNLVHRKITLVSFLQSYCGKNLSNLSGLDRPGIVHRLDKDTSGLMLVAKNNITHENISLQFKKKTIMRMYLKD